MTVTILPIAVTAAKSPKPIVVTTAKQYQRASGKFVIDGSMCARIKDATTINPTRPSKISNANVLIITFTNVVTFK